MKQGVGTYAGGKLFGTGMEKIGLRDPGASGIGEFINQPTKSRIGGFFGRGENQVTGTNLVHADDVVLAAGFKPSYILDIGPPC